MHNPSLHLPQRLPAREAQRLCRALVATVGAMVCVVVLLVGGRAHAAEFSSDERCVDALVLAAASMTFADPSLLTTRAVQHASVIEAASEEPFDGGMSCDGPSTCSPHLVAAYVEAARPAPTKHEPLRVPMCSTSDPESCVLSSGAPPGQSQLAFGSTLIPPVTRLELDLRPLASTSRSVAAAERISRRHAREQALCARDIASRLERPPRA